MKPVVRTLSIEDVHAKPVISALEKAKRISLSLPPVASKKALLDEKKGSFSALAFDTIRITKSVFNLCVFFCF